MEVAGVGGAAAFRHKGPSCVKVGVTWVVTVRHIVGGVATPDECVTDIGDGPAA